MRERVFANEEPQRKDGASCWRRGQGAVNVLKAWGDRLARPSRSPVSLSHLLGLPGAAVSVSPCLGACERCAVWLCDGCRRS